MNPFDQFDAEISTGGISANPFDQFDQKQRASNNKRTQEQNKGVIADLGTDLKRGVLNLPSAATGLLDIPVAAATGRPMVSEGWDGIGKLTGFQPGKWAKEAENEYSDGRKQARQNIDDAWKNGTGLEIAKSYIDNPSQTFGSIAESIPSMLAVGFAGRAVLGVGAKAVPSGAGAVGPSLPGVVTRAVGEKWAPAVAAGIGEGSVMAGQSMSDLVEKGVEPRVAAGYATAIGGTGGLIGVAGGQAARRLGVVDPETIMTGGVARATTDGIEDATKMQAAKEVGKRMIGGGISEGVLEELPQSLAEKGLSNLAQDKPFTEDLARAGVEGTLAGTVMGAGFNVIPPKSEQPEIDAATPLAATQKLPDTGPMSRAANKAMDSGAVNAGDVLGVPAQEQSPVAGLSGAVADSMQPVDAGAQALVDVQRQPATLSGPDRVREIETRLAELQTADPASPEAAALAGERDQITAGWPQAVGGAPTSFSTESGARLDARYALMDASQVVTSHDEQLRPSPSYPKELQPRERDRAASEMQISGIAQRLDPARMGESADSATGAPIVGADGLVESGNARSIALKRVYRGNPEKAAAYRQFLQDNAQRFGLDPQAVSGMQNPVLVRVRETPVDRVEFARQANASTVAQMSPSEQARADAGRLDTMDDLQPTDDGDFMSSRDFIRRFVGRLPGTEQAGMMDANGQLSQSGYTRVRNAILAKAYGDSPVLTRMVESLDDNLRNVGKALMRAAPDVAKMRADITDGALFEADITPDLLAGVETLSRLKDEGRSISEALSQADMLGGGMSPEAGQLLAFMDENIRKPRRIAEFIQRYTEALRAAGNPNQGSLLGETQAPSKRDIINAAWNQANESAGQIGQQQSGQPQGNPGSGQKAGEQRGIAQGGSNGAQGGDAVARPETALSFAAGEMPRGQDNFNEAAAELGTRLSDFSTMARMVPEKTPDLMPTLVRLFKASAGEVGSNPKDLVAHVKQQLKARPDTKAIWNKISDDIYRKAARQALPQRPASGPGQVEESPRFSRAAGAEPESERQFKETERSYGGREAYDRAKANGKTKLNYRQWVQVRTPAFKAWFGDWEIASSAPKRQASTFDEARVAAKAFQGKPLENTTTGMKAVVSRNNLDKMLNSKAVSKSESAQAHAFAVANLDDLFSRSLIGWTKPDADGDPNIKAIHRFFAPVMVGGRAMLAKMTVKETAIENDPNPLYTVEAVEFNEKSPAAQWVAAASSADGVDLTSIRSAGDVLTLAQRVQEFNPDTVSKVTDPQTGEPLVVYHGTNADFDAFDNAKTGANDRGLWGKGHYFTSVVRGANSYAERQGDGAQVIPAFALLKNPLILTTGQDLVTRLPDGTNYRDLLGMNLDGSKIKGVAQSGGHDGVVQIKPDGFIGDLVAYTPTQIKSATGNTGDFDVANPDIRFSRLFAPDAYDTKQYADAVDRIAAMETPPRTDLTVGDTPAVLRALGAQALPVQMPSSMIHKASRPEIRQHDVPVAVLRDLPALLADPVMVFDSKTEQGALVVLVDAKDSSGRSVVVAVHLSAKGSGFHSINKIASIYGKDDVADIERWMRGDLRYYQKEKAPGWLHAVGLQLPEANTIKRLNPSVVTDEDIVKTDGAFNFSRGSGSGMAIRDLQAVVDRVSQHLKNLPVVHVFDSPAALSAEVPAQKVLRDFIRQAGAWNDVEGATHEGEIYLFASGLADEARAEHVLAVHEVTHYGLRGAVGEKRLDAALQEVWAANARVRKAAAALKERFGLESNVEATEEVLADMRPDELAKLIGWRRVVKVVRDWLSRAGFERLASRFDALMKAGMTDQEKADVMVADLVTSAREWVRNGKGRPFMGGTRLADGSLADDLAEQEKWLTREAKVRGFKTIDELSEKNYQAFENLAKLWREKHQVDGALLSRKAGTPPRLSRANTPDTRSQVRGMARRADTINAAWKAPEPTRMDDFIYTLQNKHVDMHRVVSAIDAQIGKIEDAFNPYLQEELFHGRAAKGVTDFLQKEMRPLLRVMRLNRVSMTELEKFLHARHAPEANAHIAKINPDDPGLQDGGSGMTNGEAAELLAGIAPGRRAVLDQLAGMVDAMNASTRKLLVDAGLESKETVAAWEKAYKFYVPLQREDAEAGGLGIGQGYSVRGSSSKRRTGSTKAVVDILANIALQRERTIVRAEKNRVSQANYALALKAPNPDFWMPVNPDAVTALSQKKKDALVAELEGMGLDAADAQAFVMEPMQRYVDPRTGTVAERINPVMRNADNVLTVRVNGKDRFVFYNRKDERAQRMVHALKNLDADQLGGLLQVTAKFTRYLAAVNTQYNPVFGVVNLTRDVQGALLQLSTTPIAGAQKQVLRDVWPAMKGIYVTLRNVRKGDADPGGEWAALWEEFQRAGGRTGYRDQFSNSEARADALRSELNPEGWMDGKLGKVFTANGGLKVPMAQAQKMAGGLFGWLSDYNDTLENGVRLAAYKAALDKGMSKQQAASVAKNLTVNFNRKGQVATQAGALYAFFNAAMQGSTRMAQTLAGPAGKRIILGGLTLGAVQALALALAGFDDEEPPQFVRERSLIIPIGDGKYVSIPMPLGYHVIPGVSRVTTEWALSGFRDTAKRFGEVTAMFADSFNPIGNAGWSIQTIAPSVVDPLAALAENRDWTGKNIAREDFNSLHPTPGYTRAKDTASELSKVISYWANLATGGTDYKPGIISPTPDQIDYLIGQLTGGVGRESLKLEQTAMSMMTGEELPPHKIPLFGRFYGDSTGQSSQANRFYSNLREINLHRAEIDGRSENGGDVDEYIRDNPVARLAPASQRVESMVRKLRAVKREALKAGDSDQVKMADARITELMQQFNEQVAAVDGGG